LITTEANTNSLGCMEDQVNMGILVDHPLAGAAGGITKLSQLMIDIDKDWQGYGITNLKELAAGMTKGDLLVQDGSVLIKVSPGNMGDEFTSGGPGNIPSWEPPPTP
jgi:hypothetical protein